MSTGKNSRHRRHTSKSAFPKALTTEGAEGHRGKSIEKIFE
jgi:hypothetical protein